MPKAQVGAPPFQWDTVFGHYAVARLWKRCRTAGRRVTIIFLVAWPQIRKACAYMISNLRASPPTRLPFSRTSEIGQSAGRTARDRRPVLGHGTFIGQELSA